MFVRPDFITADAVAGLLKANAEQPAAARRRVNGPWSDCPLGDLAGEITTDRLAERVRREMAEHYRDLPALVPDYVAYTVLGAGAHHPLHADAVKLDGTPNHTPNRVCTAMLYLGGGGEDFDGGSILFPGLGVTFIPKAGALVGFLCDLGHRHQVPTVTRGERHAIAFWYRAATTPLET